MVLKHEMLHNVLMKIVFVFKRQSSLIISLMVLLLCCYCGVTYFFKSEVCFDVVMELFGMFISDEEFQLPQPTRIET
jgi:hypothetical protein